MFAILLLDVILIPANWMVVTVLLQAAAVQSKNSGTSHATPNAIPQNVILIMEIALIQAALNARKVL